MTRRTVAHCISTYLITVFQTGRNFGGSFFFAVCYGWTIILQQCLQTAKWVWSPLGSGNTAVQLSALYTSPTLSATIHFVTDRQTDRRRYDDNRRSHCFTVRSAKNGTVEISASGIDIGSVVAVSQSREEGYSRTDAAFSAVRSAAMYIVRRTS